MRAEAPEGLIKPVTNAAQVIGIATAAAQSHINIDRLPRFCIIWPQICTLCHNPTLQLCCMLSVMIQHSSVTGISTSAEQQQLAAE